MLHNFVLYIFFLGSLSLKPMSPDGVFLRPIYGIAARARQGRPFGESNSIFKIFPSSDEVAQLRGAVSHRITTGLCAPLLRSLRSLRCSVLALFASLVRMRAVLEDLDSAHRIALRTHSALRRNVT